MLGLDDQVDRRELGRRRLIGDHHDLRRAGERRRHADHARDLALRERHVHVPRPDDHVDGPDRLGPVRESGDRLRAADPVHLVHAGEGGRCQRDGRHAAVGIGRYAERDLGDASDTCRDCGHEHGRGIGGAATRHVQPGSIDRHDELAEQHAVPLDPHVAAELGFVVGGDLLARVFEGGPDVGGCILKRGEQLVIVVP